MPLNGSGPISLAGATAGQSIALELGLSSTGTISLNQASVRTLADVPSGAIIMPTNFYGKNCISPIF
jgi:predicted ATP-grasp superfamily ATP-dependent carboligase